MDILQRALAARGEEAGPDLNPRQDQPGDAALKQHAFRGLNARRANPTVEARARSAHEAGEKLLAAQRERQATALRQALGLEPSAEQALAADPRPKPTAWTPVLFISSSMPLPILRSYAVQLEKVGGVMAFRGLPGGMNRVGPMARLSAAILRRDEGCEGPNCEMRDVQLIVDPIAFRQNGVTRVPALAMIPGDPAKPYCERDETSPRSAHIVYGDSALAGLLDEYARLGGKEEVDHAETLLRPR